MNMGPFWIDMHTHTIVSGHAYGTIREMARAAADRGLKLLGISEHGPGIPGTCNPFYFNNLGAVPRELFGVRLMLGCEINVGNHGELMLEDQYLEKLDYAIAGIHMNCYSDQGRERNTDNLIACMANAKVSIVSHPDDDHTPLNYERLVTAAREYNVALELNNSSLLKQDSRLNCVANYSRMLSLCMENRVPIIVNSDAHDPSWVGRFDEARELLDAIGFEERLILNRDWLAAEQFFSAVHS